MTNRGHPAVTQEVAGSSPVNPAIYQSCHEITKGRLGDPFSFEGNTIYGAAIKCAERSKALLYGPNLFLLFDLCFYVCFRIVMSKLSYCVYVLQSLKDGDLYTGFTENLKQRLTQHFHGHNLSTAPRRPFRLIFCEYYLSKSDALRREAYFKTTAGKRALKLMLVETLGKTEGD